jgi:bifunctional non-homologous end joining protein LigD
MSTNARRRRASSTRPSRKPPVLITNVTSAVVGVRISHPDRLIYPELRISRIQLARYYERIADWIVPHVAGRPLTLVHCPAGLAAPCHFVKHARRGVRTHCGECGFKRRPRWASTWWRILSRQSSRSRKWNRRDSYLELHGRRPRTSKPARVGPRSGSSSDLETDRHGRGARPRCARDIGPAIVGQDHGGRGLHVVVPLKRKRTVTECLAFSRAVSEAIAKTDPAAYTTAFPKVGRERHILIDYLRNNRTNTSVCAFSPRARPGATVSMPLSWNDLDERPDRWTLVTVPSRLERLRADPWKDYWSGAQIISHRSSRSRNCL